MLCPCPSERLKAHEVLRKYILNLACIFSQFSCCCLAVSSVCSIGYFSSHCFRNHQIHTSLLVKLKYMLARPSLDLWKWSGHWSGSWSQCSLSAQTILCNEQVKEVGSESEYFIHFTTFIFILQSWPCMFDWTLYEFFFVPYHLSLLDLEMF